MAYKLPYDIDKLYSNCLYVYCVHLACIPRMEPMKRDISWDGITFSFDSYYNALGIISFDFANDNIYGAFRKDGSRFSWYPDKKAIDFFNDASDEIKNVVSSSILDKFNVNLVLQKKSLLNKEIVETIPIITTSLWNVGKFLYSYDALDTFILQGGKYIDDIYLDKDKLIEWLKKEYNVLDNELEFAEKLYEIKLQGTNNINKELLLILGEKVYECNTLIKILEKSGMQIEK